MFSYTAIVGSGDDERAGSWYIDAGTHVRVMKEKWMVGSMAMRKATTRVGDTEVRMEGGTCNLP